MSDTAMALRKARENSALVFANPQHWEATTDLYRTETTELIFTPENFHDLQGKYMPNKSATDKIGEAAGVNFIDAACAVTTETRDDPVCGKRGVFVAQAQGQVRMPDGSWRKSTVEAYEFDPVLRAMLDCNVNELTEETRRTYKTRKGVPLGRAILEYIKVGRQRAATGARLRVIRQLTGMPCSFDKADIGRPMKFVRIAQNTSYILQTAEGRAMATAQALGFDAAALFGANKPAIESGPALRELTGRIDAKKEAPALPAAPEDWLPGDPVPPAEAGDDDLVSAAEAGWEAAGDGETDFDKLTRELKELVAKNKTALDRQTLSGNPYLFALSELQDLTADENSREVMIDRIRRFLEMTEAAK